MAKQCRSRILHPFEESAVASVAKQGHPEVFPQLYAALQRNSILHAFKVVMHNNSISQDMK
jgi:hypothetical protein